MKKTLMIMLALVLVIAMSVTGTLAYLTSTTGVVTNTFTVGNVKITLDEAKTNEYGVPTSGRGNGNEYKLIPGHSYTKDPTIHVDAASESCWLFVQVVNGLGTNETEATTGDYKTIEQQMKDNGWTKVEGNTWRYKEIVSAGANVPVFGTFTVAEDAPLTGVQNITIVACAVQSDGLTVEEAYAEVSFEQSAA